MSFERTKPQSPKIKRKIKKIKAGFPIFVYLFVIILLKLIPKTGTQQNDIPPIINAVSSLPTGNSLDSLPSIPLNTSFFSSDSIPLQKSIINQQKKRDERNENQLNNSKKKTYIQKNVPYSTFNLNTVDSLKLISIYGIGAVYAKRIIKYRQRLGGFISKVQLKEIYGMNDENYERIKESLFIKPKFQPRQIDFFSCNFKKLLAHPYCDYPMTKILFNFKRQWIKRNKKKDSKVLTRDYFKNLLFNLHNIEIKKLEKLFVYLKFKINSDNSNSNSATMNE